MKSAPIVIPNLAPLVSANDQMPLFIFENVVSVDNVVEFLEELEAIGRFPFANQAKDIANGLRIVKQVQLGHRVTVLCINEEVAIGGEVVGLVRRRALQVDQLVVFVESIRFHAYSALKALNHFNIFLF